jgi:plasmid stability protein
MANLTITIDDALLRSARMRALEQGTSVNALLREYLEAYAGSAGLQERALEDLLALSAAATSRRGGGAWTRDELHEREALPGPASPEEDAGR